MSTLEIANACLVRVTYSYPHIVEMGGSTSGWYHAGTLALCVQSKHNQGSTEKL